MENTISARAIKKIGEYRLYKVENYGYYEIYYGTKARGVQVANLFNPEIFEDVVYKLQQELKALMEAN